MSNHKPYLHNTLIWIESVTVILILIWILTRVTRCVVDLDSIQITSMKTTV